MNSTLKIIKSRGAIVFAGLAISVFLLVMTGRTIKWEVVTNAFKSAVWLPWVPLAVFTYMVGMLLRGLRLQQLVGNEANLTVATASNIIAVGYAVNNILPARLGEFARAGMLAERTGLPYALSLTVTFLERLLDGLTILSLFVIASFITPTQDWMRNASQIAALAFAMVIPCVMMLALFPQMSLSLISQLSHPFGRKLHHKALAITTQVTRGFSCLRDAGSAMVVLFLSFLIWGVEGLMFALVMPCFLMLFSPVKALAVMSFTNLGILVPSTPGYLAVYHRCCSEALQAVTSQQGAGMLTPFLPADVLRVIMPVSVNMVDPSTAISYAVVVHLIFYATVTIWGVIAMARYGMELGTTAALAWEAKPLPLQELEAQAHNFALITSTPVVKNEVLCFKKTPFWRSLTEAMVLPAEEHQLSLAEEERARALEDATDFLCREISSLPPKLAGMLKIGTIGFRVLAALISFNTFENLSLKRRSAMVNAWSYGKVSLTRKLFKPLRSLALLAFFENEAVQTALEKATGACATPPLKATEEGAIAVEKSEATT
ncbi:MAG: flippase-like domain-containing protein [Candidatus Obscuribacter sp.]|nr:flippase-like domain-containing protein [Candidatus Obscuribacter sp.]MBK9280911.1 flippase-like domain-containing protein [Candidatus Obscuribacter sp.]